MKVILCPNIHTSELWSQLSQEDPYIHLPVGVLSLAAAIMEARLPDTYVEILDFNLLLHNHELQFGEHLPIRAAEIICETHADIVGFSSLCNSYHITLLTAQRLKEFSPKTLVILGGPQATAADIATMSHFPEIDLVVRGEGERTLVQLLQTLQSEGDLRAVNGLTLRHDNEIIRTADALPIEDLNQLPLPLFELVSTDDYRMRAIPLETGRGCPYRCRFCSTSRFWGKQYRSKSVERVIKDMEKLSKAFRSNKFSFIHDTFGANRDWAVKLCESLISMGAPYIWGASVRADLADQTLLELMVNAGCRYLFFGVESASPMVQHHIGKNIDLQWANDVIRKAQDLGIEPTISFIIGFPEERPADLEQTLDMFLRFHLGGSAACQLHSLTPLSGTPYANLDSLCLDNFSSDFSTGIDMIAPMSRILIDSYPEIFSANYHLETPYLDRTETVAAHFYSLILSHPATALGLKHFDGIPLLEQFRRFSQYLDKIGTPAYSTVSSYVTGAKQIRNHLKQYMEREIDRSPARELLKDLLRYETILYKQKSCIEPDSAPDVLEDKCPRLVPEADLVYFKSNVAELVSALASAKHSHAMEKSQVSTVEVPRNSSYSGDNFAGTDKQETGIIKTQHCFQTSAYILFYREERGTMHSLSLSDIIFNFVCQCKGDRKYREIVQAVAQDYAMEIISCELNTIEQILGYSCEAAARDLTNRGILKWH